MTESDYMELMQPLCIHNISRYCGVMSQVNAKSFLQAHFGAVSVKQEHCPIDLCITFETLLC